MNDIFSYEKLETFFSNFAFVILFVSMLSYWMNTSKMLIKTSTFKNQFSTEENPSSLLSNSVTLTGQPLSLSPNLSFPNKKEISNQSFFNSFYFGPLGMLISNFSLFSLLILRWMESEHFPLSNLYESLIFLAWSLSLFHLILEKMTDSSIKWLGSITSPISLFTIAFANFSLPLDMQRSSALVPALQSNWLMMHVTVMILSYAALIFGSLLSIGFLILTYSMPLKETELVLTQNNMNLQIPSKLKWALSLDNLSYRMLGLGFPLLTIGILSGAVWANEAWGSYWSWDPKETWALLTWFVFAIYLHVRITKNWQGKKPALIASFGFFVVWVCYLGVNLLGEGLHSYGWIQF